jgi:broad specificity phosphatase PhoE
VKQRRFLLLVRHGERLDSSYSVSEEERRATKVANEIDIPLSRRGKEQAVTTGEYIKKML